MGYSLFDAHRDRVWVPPRKKLKADLPKKNARLNCWGAISTEGATSLHIYTETLTSDRYWDILEEHKEEMDQLLPQGYNFQHDNLRAH